LAKDWEESVSIIICTKNRVFLLKKCIDSILNNKINFSYEIIIVDDHSTDETPSFLKEISQDKKIKTFVNLKNGPAAARNLGIRNSRGKIVIFLDDDAKASYNLICEYKKFFDNNPQYHGCYGPTMQENLLVKGKKYRRNRQELNLKFFTVNLAVRRQVFKNIGLFDERFKFAALEDIDFGKRFEKKGYLIGYNKKCKVIHKKFIILKELLNRSFVQGVQLKIFVKKWLNYDKIICCKFIFSSIYQYIKNLLTAFILRVKLLKNELNYSLYQKNEFTFSLYFILYLFLQFIGFLFG